MPHLFSPLKVTRIRLPNRIVLAPLASGHAAPDGFITEQLTEYYLRRAHGGAGLLIVEPSLVQPPDPHLQLAHLGLYHDAFVPGLAQLARQVHSSSARLLVALDAPAASATGNTEQIAALREAFIAAAWRALAAGCDGVMLSAADGGPLHTMISPLRNKRHDSYGGSLDGRLRLSLEIIGGICEWLGQRLVTAVRLNADELVTGGITLQDARLLAKRLVAAGAGMLDITIAEQPGTQIAHFPGWRVPLATGIKRVMPDVPIMTGGGLDDPMLADALIRDNSVDLVMLGRALQLTPDWPQQAYSTLHPERTGTTLASGETSLQEFVFDDEDLYA